MEIIHNLRKNRVIMEKKEILPFIRSVELFRGLKDMEFQLLAQELEEKKYWLFLVLG